MRGEDSEDIEAAPVRLRLRYWELDTTLDYSKCKAKLWKYKL